MVGAYIDSHEASHGFLLSNGVFTTIDYPDSTLSVAAGINNNGAIAGQYNDADGFGHGFVFSNNEFVTRDLPGYQTYPTAIDDFGDLVGFCSDTQFNLHGCVSIDGPFTLLDYPGATASLTLGINFQGGSIVGGFGNVNGTSFEHGFLYKNGTFTTIDYPGNTATVAFGISDNGTIVGVYSVPPSSLSNAFSLISGNFSTRNVPGAIQTRAINLNDSNQVVGWYVDSNNVTHGYVMTN
jgi:uncharacterized membrane protein